MNREYTDTGIRINRSQRRWRRYGSKILGICIAAAAIIAIIAIAANIGKGGAAGGNTASGGSSSGGQDKTAEAVTTTAGDETTSGNETPSGSETTESTSATEASGSGKGGTVTGKPTAEDFSSEAFYEDAAFVGDIFVYGVDEYGFVPSSNLFSATFMTAAKAMDLTEDISSVNPSKILVMLGFDDDNLAEDRTPEASAESIIALLEALKEANPSAKIYAVSEIPISEEYNDGGGDYVSQDDLDEINSLVKTGAAAAGIGYIDVAESLKEGGFLSTEYTNDGCHVKKEYYPFVLNGIAGAAK